MPSPYRRLKHVLFGRPLPSERLEHERLDKKTALAVLSSDAISSVAYATDQILFVLGGAIGLAAVNYVLPISGVIVGLLVLVGLSYRQTVFAYPNGGGSYTVARENLGVMLRRVDHSPRHGEPARRARVGRGLLAPDVRLHPHDARAPRRRRVPVLERA